MTWHTLARFQKAKSVVTIILNDFTIFGQSFARKYCSGVFTDVNTTEPELTSLIHLWGELQILP